MTGKVKKSLFYQHDKADCGIACLMMILKYYDRNRSFEELRYLSGTTKEGTTLLGLYQCANTIGFTAEGCKGNTDELEKRNIPIILRVLQDNLLHYVVFFHYDRKRKKYIIGDPAKGILELAKEELNTIWEEGYCLTVIPDGNYADICNIKDYKRDKRKFLTGLIAKDKRVLFHGLFFSLIISILGLSSSVYSQQLVDHILPSQDSTKIIWSVVILGILLITRVALVYLKDTLFSFQSKSFNNRIANRFYSELLYLPKLFFNTRKVGDLVARLNDTAKVQSVIYQFFNTYINDLLTILVSVIVIFYYSEFVGIVTICFIPVLICLIVQKSKTIMQKQRDVQISYALTEANYISTITGIADIKNLNREDFFSHQNGSLFESFQTKNFSLACTYIKLNASINMISIIFLIATISISIYQISADNLSIGDLIALLSISGLIISYNSSISFLFIPFTESKISFELMYNLIYINKDKVKTELDSLEAIETIKAENISFKYPGIARNLYENSGLTLNKGTITALTGNCGTGKTTLIDILSGSYPLEKGTIFYNGIDISSINKQDILKKVRVVPQHVHIFNGSILFNITMDELFDADKINLLFSKFNLSSFFNGFPQNINTIVGEEGVSLSGGQKQIIGLLRALYDEPQVLILDEPTASLDKECIELIYGLLVKIKPEMTVLLITHDPLKFEAIIDRTYKIENARIIEVVQ